MAAVTLTVPDIALFTDVENTRVPLSHLVTQNPNVTGEGVFIRFEGRTTPTGFRGEGINTVHSLEAVYSRQEHATALALLDLFRTAFDATDARLQLRTYGGQVSGMDPLAIVEVHAWQPGREPGGILRITFEATTVHYTLGVE